ncbi:GDP-mannose transporter GONST4 [Rhynchospora pubera]|uniref:GDP-mannose transporter GONST4 n=1 Tax=Rhynchospora pubera TaxID=906938 RepID=A0AAV8G084_9POAL|nr:GDP-mannose transporter GONST4 [Rhynchospora pubera]
MVYIKHIVSNLGLNTLAFVLYNNLVSLMMSPFFWFTTGEYSEFFSEMQSRTDDWFQFDAFVAVSASCVFGLLISFFGFAAQRAISATTFTVTGVVNKFFTVAINVMIWDKHANMAGLFCLISTLMGGVLYQQSVTKSVSVPVIVNKVIASDDEEEKQLLVEQKKGILFKFWSWYSV